MERRDFWPTCHRAFDGHRDRRGAAKTHHKHCQAQRCSVKDRVDIRSHILHELSNVDLL